MVQSPLFFMKTFFSLFIFSFASLSLLEAAYRIEGFATIYDGNKRLFLMSTFLPYNPSILSLRSNREVKEACLNFWKQGTFTHFDEREDRPYDLLWIDQPGSEWETLSLAPEVLRGASLIYTSTHLQGDLFIRFKANLEQAGFTLLTHWFWEGEKGHALFLKTSLYHAAMNALVSSPPDLRSLPTPTHSFALEKYFKPALGKSEEHRIEEIDFIYMINLDERPEKFALASSGLEPYGIYPYRFSAVNGWRLPPSAFKEVGASFLPGTLKEPLLGSTYKEIEGQPVLHTELLQENGTGYFTRGLARGPIGIVLSHLSVLKDALDSGYQTIWVMEDDVEATADPSQIPHLIRQLDQLDPEWDIFFTDTDTKDTHGVHVPCRALAARPNVPIPPLSTFLEKFYPIGQGFYRTGMRYGAYSMILRRSAMEKILEYYRTYQIFIPYDMDFWLCPNLKMYHYETDIISHRAGALSDNDTPRYSSINGSP